MRNLLAALMVLVCASSISTQTKSKSGTVDRVDTSGLGLCGTSSDWIWEINKQARRALSLRHQRKPNRVPPSGTPASVFTAQPSFPVAQVITCGKFKIYYEDLLQSNNDGFAHPMLGTARRNTLCQVLTYVQGVYDFTQLPPNDFIDLYVMWSYAPTTNPAPSTTGFLAQAGPFFNSNYGGSGFAGFYGGHMFDHVTTGLDPQPGQYDGVIQVNFDKVYSGGNISLYISYWDDYTNTANPCAFDLFTILLHEVTHVMGWFSNVKEDSTPNHSAQNTLNNSFTLFDKHFFYYGEASTPSTFTGNKLVTGTSPAINPNVNVNSDPLRSNKVWMLNFGIPLNHPAYSGDFNGYSSTPPPSNPLSLLSHMNDNVHSFTRMAQYSPGFQPNYVMGPAIAREQLKREWTNFEMRALLIIGYQLNSNFATSTSLSGGGVSNQNLLTVNVPPQRSLPAQVTEYTNGSTSSITWADTMPVTATIVTNNNTSSSPNATSIVIQVNSLGTDANGDVVRIFPNSIFNIRGTGRLVTGIGANNHNRLTLNAAGTQVTFRPAPGFRGRAQFGFYLWDGKEKGSFCVATIDVQNVGSIFLNNLALTHNKVMNGSFENGTEVRQRLLNENIEHAGFEFYREGPFMGGAHLSDNQPSFNVSNNIWTWNAGEFIYQSWKECNHLNGGVKGNYGDVWADFNGTIFSVNVINPLANSITNPNHRYHNFHGWSFYELITPVTGCNYYRFEMDVNLERAGVPVGNNFNGMLDLVTNIGANPATATSLQSIPLTIPVTTVTANAWQHFSIEFPYCSPTPSSFIRLATVNLAGVFQEPLIDNLALSEISPKPALIVSATASQATGSCCSTLSATATNASCATTYTWQPGNLSGQNVTVCPTVPTTYTVTANDGCRTTTSTVNVSSAGSGVTTWPKHPAGNVREFFTATARASNDDLFAAGYFTNSVSISGFPTWTVPNNNRQLMVARFSENCGTLWAVQLGNPLNSETVNDMVVDSNGNIFITGSIGATTTFGAFTLTGPAMYVLKLDGSNGNILAAAASSVSNSAEGVSVSIDPANPANNVYVGGQYRGSVNFGSLPPTTSVSGSMDVIVVKYNNTLSPQWRNSFGSSAPDYNGGIAYSNAGALYVAGSMNRAFSIGNVTFLNFATNTTDMFIGRFNPATGAFILGRMEGNNSDSCNVRDIAVDGSGFVYFTGGYKGTFNATAPALNATTTNIFIGRWNPNLGNSWAYSMGGGAVDEGRSVSLDALGNVYFAGNFVGPAVFASFTPSLLSGGSNMFTVKVSLTGVRSFAAQSSTGALSNGSNYSLTTLPSGQSYVAGSFAGTITFGSSGLQTSNATDAIIGRLNSAGSFY